MHRGNLSKKPPRHKVLERLQNHANKHQPDQFVPLPVHQIRPKLLLAFCLEKVFDWLFSVLSVSSVVEKKEVSRVCGG